MVVNGLYSWTDIMESSRREYPSQKISAENSSNLSDEQIEVSTLDQKLLGKFDTMPNYASESPIPTQNQ